MSSPTTPRSGKRRLQISSTLVRRGLAAALLASIALNVVALSRPMPPVGEIDSSTPQSQIAPSTSNTATGESYRSYVADLRQRGLTADEAKRLLLSHLEARAATSSPVPSQYWGSDMDLRYFEAELAFVEQQDASRAVLLDLYGAEARVDPLFASLFQPLSRRYGFLSSAEQLAFQRYQIGRQLERAAQPRGPLLSGSQASSQAPSQQLLADELRELLDEQSVAELLYRYSPMADLLRSADIHLTEREYREAFPLLERLEAQIGGPQQYLEIRDALRERLGMERFTRLWATKDPIFAAMKAAGEQSGLSSASILSAYVIVNDAQDVMAEAALRAAADPERARTEMQAALIAQTQKLTGLVGAELAKRLLDAQSAVVMQIESERAPPAAAL